MKRTRLGKRICTWVLGIAMVLTSVNLPAFTMKAEAAVTSTIEEGTKLQYISDISTSSGEGKTGLNYANHGNLNRGTSGSGNSITAYVSFTDNADDAITMLWLMKSSSLSTITENGMKYNVTRATGDLNVGAGGDYLYLYYTKDKLAGDPIASIGVWNNMDNYLEYVTNTGTELNEYKNTSWSTFVDTYGFTRVDGSCHDFNSNAGGAAVYMFFKRAPYVKAQDSAYTYDGEPHYANIRVSDGVTLNKFGDGAIYAGDHTVTYEASKDGMISIAGSVKVTINVNYDMAGSGTKEDPYKVTNAYQLSKFRDMVNDGATNLCAELAVDIDLSPVCSAGTASWCPIGSGDCQYKGTFDGNGHKITGLFINTPSDYQGLFGYTYSAIIQNLDVSGNVSITSQNEHVAIIAGYASNGTIQNCISRGYVNGFKYVGGIVGSAYNSEYAKACQNYAAISATEYVGGIIGGGHNPYVIDCFNAGTITCTNASLGKSIGIATGHSLTLDNCLNIAKPGANVTENATYYHYSDGTGNVTKEQLESGEVAYLLNGEKTDETSVWGQKLTGADKQSYPVPNGAKVYKTTPCVSYTNNAEEISKEHVDSNQDAVCDNCGTKLHSHSGTEVAEVPATCTTAGVKEYYECSCGKYFADADCTQVIEDLNAWKNDDGKITNGKHKFSDETCQGVCEVCGVQIENGTHDFSVNGTCACGTIQIEFEVIDEADKTVRVIGLNKRLDTTHDLFIPSTVKVDGEDYSVTEIGDRAFSYLSFDGKLVIGNRIKTIGREAFSGCNFIGEVIIPNSVTSIDYDTFNGCNFIESISVPCTLDASTVLGHRNVFQRNHDFSNGATLCNLCRVCKALSETGKHDFIDSVCTNCGHVDQFTVFFSEYNDLITVENNENYPWYMRDDKVIVPGTVEDLANSSMTITAKKRVKLSFSYTFDKAPIGEDMLVIKRSTKDGDYEEDVRTPSDYNGEYPYDGDHKEPLILYPGDALTIDYCFGSDCEDEGISLTNLNIEKLTFVDILGMSLELDPAYGTFIGVNLSVDVSDDVSLFLDECPVTPDGENRTLVKDDRTGFYKLQFRCAAAEFADTHHLVACGSDDCTVPFSLSYIDQYSFTETFEYSGISYCEAVLEEGTYYPDELKAVCRTLVTFSEQARNYFMYNADGLSVGTVTADIPTTGYDQVITGKLPEGYSYYGSSLLLKDSLVIRHYFTGDIRDIDYRKCYDKTKDIYVASEWYYNPEIDLSYIDIAAPYSNMGDMYELILGKGENPYTLTYGVLTYCQRASALYPNSKLVNTCNAMYNFAKAVWERS